MAREGSPVFHDFLGLGPREVIKQNEAAISDISRESRKDTGFDEEAEKGGLTSTSSVSSGQPEACSNTVNRTESLVLAVPNLSHLNSDHFSVGNANGHQHFGNKGSVYRLETDNCTRKKRDSNKRNSLQEQFQTNTEALETSRLIKASRLEGQDEGKYKHQATEVDALYMPMQPPRPSCKGKHELSRGYCASVLTEKIFGSSGEHATLMPQMYPADEGSRTGLKGSSVVSLLNNGSSAPSATGIVSAGPTTGRSKLWSHNSGFSPQAIAMTSRQLTIFYGGQAHVFDDVPPDKADAIMSLAGSNGRSWSTSYSSRPQVPAISSASECSLGVFERERERK